MAFYVNRQLIFSEKKKKKKKKSIKMLSAVAVIST